MRLVLISACLLISSLTPSKTFLIDAVRPCRHRARMCEIQDSLFWEKSISQHIDILQRKIIVATRASADDWEPSTRPHLETSSLCSILDDNSTRVNNNTCQNYQSFNDVTMTPRSMFILTRNKNHQYHTSTAFCASATVSHARYDVRGSRGTIWIQELICFLSTGFSISGLWGMSEAPWRISGTDVPAREQLRTQKHIMHMTSSRIYSWGESAIKTS